MVATPPGAPAEWWGRLVARLIECLVFGVFYYILFISLWWFLRSVGVAGWLLGTLAWLLTGLGYVVYDYVAHSRRGRTFGKAIMKIRLTGADGGKPSRSDLVKRALVYPGPVVVMGIPVVNLLAGIFVFAVGLFILIDKPAQRGPHDRAGRTRVVKDQR